MTLFFSSASGAGKATPDRKTVAWRFRSYCGAGLSWLIGKRPPTPFQIAMARFDQRIADARRRHQAIKPIEAERQHFTTEALKAARVNHGRA